MVKKKKVSFWTKKPVKKPIKVSFQRVSGEKVSFTAKKTVLQPRKVSFYVTPKVVKKKRRKKKPSTWFRI